MNIGDRELDEVNGFEPDAIEHMQGNKAIQLDFWAAFFSAKESREKRNEKDVYKDEHRERCWGETV